MIALFLWFVCVHFTEIKLLHVSCLASAGYDFKLNFAIIFDAIVKDQTKNYQLTSYTATHLEKTSWLLTRHSDVISIY